MNQEKQKEAIQKFFKVTVEIIKSIRNGNYRNSNSLNWILHHKRLTILLFFCLFTFIVINGINGIITILFLSSVVLLISGVIKPSSVKMSSRKMVVKYVGSSVLVLFIVVAAISPQVAPVNNEISYFGAGNQTSNQAVETNTNSGDTSNNASNSELANGEADNAKADTSDSDNQTDGGQNSTDSQTASSSDSSGPLYAVASVTDGDTFKININGKNETVRAIGMDTPETVDPRKPVQCFGKEASNKAKELLSGKKVRLETDPTQGETDKYGRRLAYIYTEGGIFYNKYMIEQGYAHEYTYDIPYKYQAEFKAAQKSARENQRGLWSPSTCNGDTTQSASASSSNSTPSPAQTSASQPATSTPINTSTGKYYTSSHYSSKYYYPESCEEWKNLSPSYLKSFNSLGDLLAAYPSRSLSPQCQ